VHDGLVQNHESESVMRKTNLIVERDLKDVSDMAPFDAEVEKIVGPGARWIGHGTYLPTMTRDWQYEIDPASAHIVAEKLKDAGYLVD
jgi:hypothetical protein